MTLPSDTAPFDRFFAKTLLEKKGQNSTKKEELLTSFMRLCRQGHFSVSLLDLPSFEEELSFLIGNGEDPFPKEPLIQKGGEVYLQKNWVYRAEIIKNLQRILSAKLESLFDERFFQKSLGQMVQEKKLLPSQAEAIEQAFQSPFFVLSGGPGTGKTYTASIFIELLCKALLPNENLYVTVAAPSGIAAMHLQSMVLQRGDFPNLQIKMATLHRALSLHPGENRLFSGKKIDSNLILVDEASMMDVPLLTHLLEAVREGSRLILMGDPNQLPPIEGISLFRELSLKWGLSLSECIRTEKGPLLELAEAIRDSKGEKILSLLKEKCLSLSVSFDEKLKEYLFQRVSPVLSEERPDPERAIEHYSSFRILNALRQGPFGTDSLNREIFKMVESKRTKWQALPILITANDPRLDLYNGMTGVLLKERGKESLAYFPHLKEPLNHLPPFEIAFCLSIHKSQGSEFEEVLALFPKGSENFGKESLYTALTRAKKSFSWIGEEKTLYEIAQNSSQRPKEILNLL